MNTNAKKPVTVPAIRNAKGGTPIVSLTAYTTPMARLLDPHCDFLLVGDSLGMVLHGLPDTRSVTLDMMILHGQAVMRGASTALVVVDMPFGSVEESAETAYRNAVRVIKETGCAAIKLEGGRELAPTIAFLTARGIPVLAHVGLMPQRSAIMGGFKTQGRNDDQAEQVRLDAQAVADAGAFAVVIEGTVEPVARQITAEIDIPTIGIGASPACDGQILVVDDMIGMLSDYSPKFVRQYADTADTISNAVSEYAADVRARRFPSDEHCFGVVKK